MELDDEFPQIHAVGAFSADAMTNDIGRADNTRLSARIPILSKFHLTLTFLFSMRNCRDRRWISITDSKKYYNGTKERESERTRPTIL
ncbi:MAG: hypothetical protein AUI93_06720 [Crenarchaeota archaeon 13_1_40CM_3_52_10]|nr:MAG: hypothetical protein AUI93_06720 [Crenarchaeota archaeon 13_1_40CM_3_52_10]OLE68530.1 MAG: hypothetical protein AUF78_15685 [archaeon 13_1_20CM_2_51_12]